MKTKIKVGNVKKRVPLLPKNKKEKNKKQVPFSTTSRASRRSLAKPFFWGKLPNFLFA